MKKSSKTELFIATWAGRIGTGYWGDWEYAGYGNQSTSFWVSLRRVMPGNCHFDLTDDGRAVGDIGLYVYVTVEGTVIIDLRLRDMGSMTLAQSVQPIQRLKRLLVKGKAYAFSEVVHDTNVLTELSKAVVALGIQRTLVYHGVHESATFELVGSAIKRIAGCIEERLARMKMRHTSATLVD